MNGVNTSYVRAAFCYLVNAIVLTASLSFIGLSPVEMLANKIPGDHPVIEAEIVITFAFAVLSWLLLELSRWLEKIVFHIQQNAKENFLHSGSNIVANECQLEAYTRNAQWFFAYQGIVIDKAVSKEQSVRFFDFTDAYIHKSGQGAAIDLLYARAEYLCLAAVEMCGLCGTAILYAAFTRGTESQPLVASFVYLLATILAVALYKSAVKEWVQTVQAAYDAAPFKLKQKIRYRPKS